METYKDPEKYTAHVLQKGILARSASLKIDNVLHQKEYVFVDKVSVASDSTDEVMSMFGDGQRMVRTFRVFYVKSSNQGYVNTQFVATEIHDMTLYCRNSEYSRPSMARTPLEQ